MFRLRSRSFAAFVASAVLAVAPALGADQGRGAGRSGAPKPTPPVQAGKPATPPGQAKQPPGGGGSHGSPKAPMPIVVKPALAAKLQPLLPSGLSVEAASAGFKNLGQFVAAVHVSKNLDVPFTALRTEMVENGRSLGSAIQTLKPGTEAKKVSSRAEAEAKVEIESAR